ncbi:MAG: DUF5320 domain-containing protein [Bacteroidetes bacterium]|nr:DUF5320 domain-containing protein [Bacteroidota bacterium]
MPNFDGTGPQGQGSMTGRRRGRCNNNKDTENQNIENQLVENTEVDKAQGRGLRKRKGMKGTGGGRRFGNR